jgi:dGTPase
MEIKDIMLKREQLYSKYAALDKDAIRLKPYTPDIRPNYFRDIDRIIYDPSYTRYMNKTQVFSLVTNDHISKRMTHVQLVSKIARTIGRALSLNEDLIEAIALGHDLGHVPFGHAGEKILNEISLKNNEGYFNHNSQSVRDLMSLEDNGEGKNITIQVLDGILCHNGELELKEYKPQKKTPSEFLNDYKKTYKIEGYNKNLIPMTLEGCVVRISDIIGYLGRDIEDAIRLNIITNDNIPSSITKVLGNNNHDIINTIIMDIINNSLNKPYLKMSDNIFKALIDLKKFNYENIYNKANNKETLDNYQLMYNTLFNNFLDDINNKNEKSSIYLEFLSHMNNNYLNNTTNARKVIDYIAGMTDDYFIKQYKNYQN